MAESVPSVELSVCPHVTIGYDTASHPMNKVTFPVNTKNVEDVVMGLKNELAKAGALEVLAKTP